MKNLITDIRKQIGSYTEAGLTLNETKSHVETLLRTLLTVEQIHDYVIDMPDANHLDVAIKTAAEEPFVYIPIRTI